MLLPGIGTNDSRTLVDPTVMPWAAVARLQVPGVSRCTAVIVAPNFAVTAGHCLTKPGLGHFVQPGSIHLLLGYRSGGFTRHIVPDAVILPPGADPARTTPAETDFAVLHFAPPATQMLPLDPAPVAPGTKLHLVGFNQDRAERLEVDAGCHALSYGNTGAAGPFLVHNCAGTRGSSGGPVLVRDASGGFRVTAIQDAAGAGAGGLAIPAALVARLLPPP